MTTEKINIVQGKPILLVGPDGSGKRDFAIQMCRDMSARFIDLSGQPAMDAQMFWDQIWGPDPRESTRESANQVVLVMPRINTYARKIQNDLLDFMEFVRVMHGPSAPPILFLGTADSNSTGHLPGLVTRARKAFQAIPARILARAPKFDLYGEMLSTEVTGMIARNPECAKPCNSDLLRAASELTKMANELKFPLAPFFSYFHSKFGLAARDLIHIHMKRQSITEENHDSLLNILKGYLKDNREDFVTGLISS